jgi:glutathione synthase/RimK-type ligase-like ATP-grasp enzyme
MSQANKVVDVVVIHEHPEWQQPLFDALDSHGVSWAPFDLKQAAFGDHDLPRARLYFNQASPSAYLRGNARAVTLGLALLRQLQWQGAKVLNGADVFALELSKSAQGALLQALAIDHPKALTFNSVDALRRRHHEIGWPAMLKPDQGGSGARISVVNSFAEIEQAFADETIWQPDNLFLLQEFLPHDPSRGIVRLEFLGGELLYAMRVVTHGRFNLCPAPVCNPEDGGEGACDVPAPLAVAPVEFYPYPEVPSEAVATAKRIVAAVGLDVGGIEYLETPDGRRVFYDINANSNLRPSIAHAFGFDPFDRVVEFLQRQLRS